MSASAKFCIEWDLVMWRSFSLLGVTCLALALGQEPVATNPVPKQAMALALSQPADQGPTLELARVDRSGLLYAPPDCKKSKRPTDMLLHFHGVPRVVVEQTERAGLSVIVRVVNEGAFSDAYTEAWSRAGSFSRVVEDTRARVDRYCGHTVKLGRAALSSFSAGFAAIQQILGDEAAFDRVDSLLLADSLYAGYVDPRTKELSREGLEPFVRFAGVAVENEKLMAVTHSEVPTQGYASTRETADYLLSELGLGRKPASSPEGGTEASSGSFWLLGFPGRDADAHAEHLQGMGGTVLLRLARHWR